MNDKTICLPLSSEYKGTDVWNFLKRKANKTSQYLTIKRVMHCTQVMTTRFTHKVEQNKTYC